MRPYLIGLGSNQGDSAAIFADAAKRIAALPGLSIRAASSLYESTPAGGPAYQREFLNAALLLDADLPPEKVLDELLQIESQLGRERTTHWGPRTLDLDLLLAGDAIISTERLTVPHPRMMVRQFAVIPAAEIAPQMIVPVLEWNLSRLRDHFSVSSKSVWLMAESGAFRDDWRHALQSQLPGWKFEKVRSADFHPGVKSFLPRFVALAQHDPRTPPGSDLDLGDEGVARPLLQQFAEFLQSRGKRITSPRKALVEFILSGDGQFSVDELSAQLSAREKRKKINLPTIYRTLNELVEAGLLRKLDRGGRAVYELISPARFRIPWVVVDSKSVEAATAEVVAHCTASDTIMEVVAGPDWLPR